MPGDVVQLVASKDLFTGLSAAVFAYGVHLAAPAAYGLLTFVELLVFARRARRADARWMEDAPLRPGEAVLRGAVELAPGHDAALRVEIDQVGTESKGKNGWSQTWRETARRVHAHPFFLHDRRGPRVRVEPDQRAMLIDGLDRVERADVARRTKIAELSPGEEIYALGELVLAPETGGAYRGGGDALVLRPPRRGRMLVSSEPLGERYRSAPPARATGSSRSASTCSSSPWRTSGTTRARWGRAEIGVVEESVARTGKNARCAVTVRRPNGETFEDTLAHRECRRLPRGTRVPVVAIPGSPWFAHVGQVTGIHAASGILGTIALLFLVLLHRLPSRPWYERPLVETSSGRLETPERRAHPHRR